MRGKIKRISPKEGIGFISTDAGDEIIFDQYSLMGYGFDSFNVGDYVEFEIEQAAKAPKAVKVRITF